MKSNQVVKETLEQLKHFSDFVVISHYNPDADAYGSSCGLAAALRTAGKNVDVFNESGILPGYDYIPGIDCLKDKLPDLTRLRDRACIVVCDCGDLARCGETFIPQLKGFSPIINIDHHTSNSLFGSVNLVDEHASSTSEMIYHLLKAGSFEITKEVAICLFAGIMADTGSFRYSNTTQQTFLAAADLTHLGASSDLIGRAMFGNNSQGAVRLHALALSALKLHFDGKICELVVDDEMVKASGASVDDSDGLVEKGRDITGVLISFLIRWDGEIWRVSLRSREARYDVSKVAQIFGGGGHKSAAAFRWRKSLEELKTRLLVELEEACRQAESC